MTTYYYDPPVTPRKIDKGIGYSPSENPFEVVALDSHAHPALSDALALAELKTFDMLFDWPDGDGAWIYQWFTPESARRMRNIARLRAA